MSRTATEWLEEADLSLELAKVLVDKPWEHDRHYSYDLDGTSCLKCKCKTEELHDPCPVPDPIDIKDSSSALRALREYKGQCFGPVFAKPLIPAMLEVYRHYNKTGGHVESQELFRWFLFDAPNEALWIAAAMCKETAAGCGG